MNREQMKADLVKMKQMNEEFIEKYTEEVGEFLRDMEVSGEEGLQQELWFELMDHIHGMIHVFNYMNKKVTREGVLSRGEDGRILFNGEEIPIMEEIEVYYQGDKWEREMWTRTYVSGGPNPYLVGVGRSVDVRGMKARIRE